MPAPTTCSLRGRFLIFLRVLVVCVLVQIVVFHEPEIDERLPPYACHTRKDTQPRSRCPALRTFRWPATAGSLIWVSARRSLRRPSRGSLPLQPRPRSRGSSPSKVDRHEGRPP